MNSFSSNLLTWWRAPGVQKLLLISLLLCLILLLMSSCATTTETKGVVHDYCTITTPIRPSRADTAETKRQVATQIATYEKLCEVHSN